MLSLLLLDGLSSKELVDNFVQNRGVDKFTGVAWYSNLLGEIEYIEIYLNGQKESFCIVSHEEECNISNAFLSNYDFVREKSLSRYSGDESGGGEVKDYCPYCHVAAGGTHTCCPHHPWAGGLSTCRICAPYPTTCPLCHMSRENCKCSFTDKDNNPTICKKCGTPLSVGIRRCSYCGYSN